MKRSFPLMQTFLWLLFFGLLVFSGFQLKIDPAKFVKGIPNLWVLATDAFPPDSSLLKTALIAILETLQIAFLGTCLGMILSLPFSLLSARNLFPATISACARAFLGAIRTMPALLWAVFFVIMVGFGPFAGVLATILYTMGFLGKLQYEAIEGIHPEPLEAVSGIGPSKLQLIRFVVLPEAANHLISQMLFMFEYNIRASAILGFVGAGGIGFYIRGYLQYLEYDKVLTLLLVVYLTVLIIDFISVKLRDKYLT